MTGAAMNHDGSVEASAELAARIRDEKSSPQSIADLLDGLTEAERIAAARSLGPALQRRLYRRVQGFLPLTLADVVPASVPALTAVRHYGRNSLPLFRLFEKRFYRLPDQDPSAPTELGGANFQSIQLLTGPGYFVAREDSERREVLVDYHHVPSAAPEGFSPIVSNEHGRSRLVYGFMIDTLRRVSEHVTVGSAARHGKSIGAFFMLCRQAEP
jgi:hypothetical protein